MAEGIFSKLGWIGIGALISSGISALLEPFFSDFYNMTKDSVVSLSLQMNPAFASNLVTYIPLILGGVGVILIGWDLVHRRRKKNQKPIVIQTRLPDVKLSEYIPKGPNLQYGRLCVKKRPDETHGGRYDRSFYYVEIINSIPSTVALNCRGSIHLDSDTYSTIWEKNEWYTISIAHRELLYLFETSIFTRNSNQVTRLYLKWGPHTVDDNAINDYNDKIDKQLTVLIQSDNAQFPSESEAFNKTIRQIIHDSIEC